MNSFPPPLSRLVPGVILLALPFIAATAQAQGQAPRVDNPDTLTSRREAMQGAKALALQGKVVPAENLLTTAITAKRNSAEWHLDATSHLVSLVSALGAEGHVAAQRAVAARALEHLEDAERLASDPRLRARALQHQGLIRERFLKDPVSAKESYRRAAAADPNNKPAKTALGRLEKAEAEVQRKLKRGGS